ncbi:MAG: hypothetical protein COB98_07110 [Flavobacteriaceae bacterium]|nr:MAG: hypothetical protein COB98_07110 [Flavobacteriaceae bacterium]
MKNIIFIIIVIFFSATTYAQEETETAPSSTINITGRYNNSQVDLVYFPDKNNVLYQGLKHGYIIERADLNDSITSIDKLKFTKIDEVHPYSEREWKDLIETSTLEEKKVLSFAKSFYDGRNKQTGGNFSFDKGIKEMKQQKFKEDFQFIIFLMNAIKNKKVMLALGLSYQDKTTTPKKKYIYRIKLKEALKGRPVNSLFYDIETVTADSINNKYDIFVKTWDQKLTFIWDETGGISGVHVERKNPASGKFELLNKTIKLRSQANSIRNSYTDENLINYTTYEYRFYGFNIYGEKIYFGKATGMPRDFTAPKKPSLQSVKHIKPEEVHLTWKIPTPIEGDLKGFVVARGTKNRGKFQLLHGKLLPKNATSYIDKTFSRENKNYYVVQAIDTSGNISSSNPFFVTLIDSIPPKKPVFISGKIDSVGIVTLDITLNKEKDLMGYRLFRANSDKHEFSAIQEGFHEKDTLFQKAQTVFKDTVTINSLTPYIYYKIKALDYNFNQSEFSEVLKVKRPDIIPPTTPVFKNIKTGTDAIELYFVLSKSEDVVAHYLYRKLALEAPWTFLSELPLDKSSFKDTSLKQGIKYYYSLRAKDDSDLYSDYAIPIYGKPYDDGVRPPVKNLRISKEKEKITLHWEYENLTKNTYFVIYKKNKKGNLVQYKNTQNLFFDENSRIKENSYAIKAFTKDGGQSKISDIVSN